MDPAGVFATSFARDQSLIRTRKQLICLVIFLLLLAVLPMLVGPRLVAVATSALITAVVTVGLQSCPGYGVQQHLGQAGIQIGSASCGEQGGTERGNSV